jgi:hypothetical protein
LQALGDRLDTADLALARYLGNGSEFDFEDKRGHLQHHGERCPICVCYNARADYLGEARKPAVAAHDVAWERPLGTVTSDELRDLHAAMVAAQSVRDAMREPGADVCYTERERIDSACAAEFAECVFETLAERYRERLADEAKLRRLHLAHKQDDKARRIETTFLDGERIRIVRLPGRKSPNAKK